MNGIFQAPCEATMKLLIASLERNLLPDMVIRRLIRLFIEARLRHVSRPTIELQRSQLIQFANSLKEMPISMHTGKPEADVYELPTTFFQIACSCCYFEHKSSTLADAENAMLELYCKRAQIKDGLTILDVGCGWGSFILYAATKYRNCKVTGLTDSAKQKQFIDDRSRQLHLKNVEVIVGDVSIYETEATYDRLISVEMFEYIKNFKDLLKKLSKWMKHDGLLFVEHYGHKNIAHHMEGILDEYWISKYDWLNQTVFSAGGTWLSMDLLLYFQEDVTVVDHWLVNGMHLKKTGDAWLKRMDNNWASMKQIMETTYGKDEAVKWTVYYRTFFMFISETYGYNNGEEYLLAHYLFKKK
ncbi:hypothetical protein FNV43_RR21083 [Rhamnella rubrinervis]|uniref:Coclaurine N-methyltransferase n=1 Tax=Rhamnella rubrinervis TaxID=2594499 RepID=A0A8K0DX70_9ROSA|nr:hypothetical protein FNV43_RR21083 [Rhamnella rubrinervis]